MKIMIACDSFKGSLKSSEVNAACRAEIADICPDCSVDSITIADGGEGTVDAVAESIEGGIWHSTVVDNPVGEKIAASYYALPDQQTAVIETASAAGLTLIESAKRNPLVTSSFGLGQMIGDAVSRGFKKILIGLGGSATNDGGTGMLQALGYRFIDIDGNEIRKRGGQILNDIASIDDTDRLKGLDDVDITVLCDVTNSLTGPNGATFVYAPQKGADLPMIRLLEKGMCNFARLMAEDITGCPGAGAAGGLGAALMAFLNAKLQPGVSTLLDLADFDNRINDADLVITGEGRIDKSTLMGKAPCGIIRRATAKNIAVLAIGGIVDIDLRPLAKTVCINPKGIDPTKALQPAVATENIRKTIANVLSNILHK